VAIHIDGDVVPPQGHDMHALPLSDARWRPHTGRGDRRPTTSLLVSSRLGCCELGRFHRRPARAPIARVHLMTFDCTRLREAV
jgi:hypothetical protein